MLKFKTKKKKEILRLCQQSLPFKIITRCSDVGLHRVKCSLLAQVSHSDSPNVWKLWPSTWFRKQTTSPTANSGWRAGCWATMTPEFRLFLLKFLPETPWAIKRDSALESEPEHASDLWLFCCEDALTFDGCWSPSDFYRMLLLLHLQVF